VSGILDAPVAPDPGAQQQQQHVGAAVPPNAEAEAHVEAPGLGEAPGPEHQGPGPAPAPAVEANLPQDRIFPQREHVQRVYPYAKKIFAYADDGTLILELSAANLRKVTEILTIFSTISGLKCNIEKTNLMQIGPEIVLEQDILNVGFNVTLTKLRFWE